MLPKGEVQLWLASLDQPEPIDFYLALLSPAELSRAAQIKFPQRYRQFVVARGILRQILARYIQVSPLDLEIHLGEQGKPYCSWCEFNLAHSGDRLLYGFSLDQAIGVDLELVRPRQISKLEQRLGYSPSSLLDFYRAWTGLEAVTKLAGRGIFANLANSYPASYPVVHFLPEINYMAAIAHTQPISSFRFRQWRDHQ
ncbi:MAG: hypothetical protein SFT94_00160 [Pseudanabaenaceae cyanobacterium bins.68]|nr:hypothetical protein [Pseudanabaenaceae cyanobacterium bins.68]